MKWWDCNDKEKLANGAQNVDAQKAKKKKKV